MLLKVVDTNIKGHSHAKTLTYSLTSGSLKAISHIFPPIITINIIHIKPNMREKIREYEPLFFSFSGFWLIVLTEGSSIKATELVSVAGKRITTKIQRFRKDFVAGSCQKTAACFIIASVRKGGFRDLC